MLIKFLNRLLRSNGYMVVRKRQYQEALTTIQNLNDSVQKSGHLCELIRRKPKIVRQIDRQTAIAETKLQDSLTTFDQETPIEV